MCNGVRVTYGRKFPNTSHLLPINVDNGDDIVIDTNQIPGNLNIQTSNEILK